MDGRIRTMAGQAFCALQWTLETMVMIFADYEPNWHCNIEKTFDDFLCMKHGFESCSSTGSVCSMDRASWGWDGGRGVSMVSEWVSFVIRNIKLGFCSPRFSSGAWSVILIILPLKLHMHFAAARYLRLYNYWILMFIYWCGCRDIWEIVGFFAGREGSAEFGLYLQRHPQFLDSLLAQFLGLFDSPFIEGN